MKIKKVCDILGNGNEYYTGTEILDQLRTAGYVVVPKSPTKKMIDAAVPHVGLRGVMLAYCAMVDAAT